VAKLGWGVITINKVEKRERKNGQGVVAVCCAHLPQLLVPKKKKMKGKILRSYGKIGGHRKINGRDILSFHPPQKLLRLLKKCTILKEQGISGLYQ